MQSSTLDPNPIELVFLMPSPLSSSPRAWKRMGHFQPCPAICRQRLNFVAEGCDGVKMKSSGAPSHYWSGNSQQSTSVIFMRLSSKMHICFESLTSSTIMGKKWILCHYTAAEKSEKKSPGTRRVAKHIRCFSYATLLA